MKALWEGIMKMLAQLWAALSEWRLMLRQLGGRLVKPSFLVITLVYLIGVVAFFGGGGVWLAQVMAHEGRAQPRDVALNIATYAFAIVFTAIGDLFLDGETNRFLKFTLFLISVAALIGCGKLTFDNIYSANAGVVVAWPTLLTAIAPVWLVWWLINGVDKRFSMVPAATAAMGGDPRQNIG